ncbi:MAG TPA: glutamate racemase [Thermoanaerobaculales bacterium]|nr:glutamate racemase [Thermoanaerobaculales bacterium]HPA81548.1 glutamate racemase [Thermoanaerobaculales bacterium]HQL30752.1 glutamate racemase [Thermoanaerobaculales bacterium]
MDDGRLPIGVFDSGVGGLTVLQAIRRSLPGEDYLYLGDTARLPYGSKSPSTVQRYALNAARHLVDRGVKLLVVACNTASSYALEEVMAACPVPVVGVVEPGVRAALATGARRIGVIGTEGTVRSEAYQRALLRADRRVTVDAAACPLFVPLAEEGWGDHPVTDLVAEHYLRPLLARGIEALILGCTHYPLLRPSLERVAGRAVRLVDSATSVATTVVTDFGGLMDTWAGEDGIVRLQLTDASDRFLDITRRILGGDPEHLEVVDIS